jgi:peptidoglycan/LPS O-acetylase OafA/YrhL
MSEKKLGAFDAVRGLAALAVVVHHLVVAFLPGLYGAALNPLFRVIYEGAFHVRVFFVLSGFVLSLSYLRGHRLQTLRSLAVRRYFRFFSPVAASILFAYLLMIAGLFYNDRSGAMMGQPPNVWLRSFYRFQPNLLEALKQSVWSTYFDFSELRSYNVVLWTMGVELKGSFLVIAFLALFAELRHRWLVYIVLCVVLHQALGGLGSLYCCFLVGVALCDLYVSGFHLKDSTAVVLIIAGLALGGVHPAWLAKRGWPLSPDACLECFCIGACFLLTGVTVSSSVQRWMSRRPLVFLGKISFPLYLVHVPVLCSAGAGVYCLFHNSLGRFGASGVAALVTLIVSLVLAWLGSLTLEPFAIWSGRVVERWLSFPLRGPEARLEITGDSETREDRVRESVVVESIDTGR